MTVLTRYIRDGHRDEANPCPDAKPADGALTVTIVRQSGRWPDEWMVQAAESVRLGFAMALAAENGAEQGAKDGRVMEVALVAGDDALLADLNSRYRNRSGPTNVLSFPSGETEHGAAFPVGPGDSLYLGDIVLAQETIMREAKAWGRKAEDHTAHLAVHGLLHLLGYRHDRPGPAAVMETMEKLILRRFGIEDPYITPATASGWRGKGIRT